MADKNTSTINEIASTIVDSFYDQLGTAPYDRITNGKLIEYLSETSCNVEVDGEIYKAEIYGAATVSKNAIVKVVVPQNQDSNMFVLMPPAQAGDGALLIPGKYILGDVYNGTLTRLWSVDASETPEPGKIPAYDSEGNLHANKFIGDVETDFIDTDSLQLDGYLVYQDKEKAGTSAHILNYAYYLFRQGERLYDDEEFRDGENDIIVYNDGYTGTGTNAVTLGVADDSTAPNSTGKVLTVSTDKSSTVTPGVGGITLKVPYGENKRFVTLMKAKLPENTEMLLQSGNIGSNGSYYFMSDNKGTGKWETYVIMWNCGSPGPFGTGGTIYVNTTTRPFTWRLASCTVFDITALETRYCEIADRAYVADRTEHKLTFTGYQEAQFDGSADVTIGLPTTLPPSGPAGGDLGGTYPNPAVVKFDGKTPDYYLDYNNHTNKPRLNTSTDSALQPNAAEVIQNTISLHQISKTGSYESLNSRPVLDTTPGTSLSPKSDELINGNIQLNRLSKTGAWTDVLNRPNPVNTLESDSDFDYLTGAMGKKLDIEKFGIELFNSTDFNEYTSHGEYYIQYSTMVKNTPFSKDEDVVDDGILCVFKSNSNYISQLYMPFARRRIWFRNATVGETPVWKEWTCVANQNTSNIFTEQQTMPSVEFTKDNNSWVIKPDYMLGQDGGSQELCFIIEANYNDSVMQSFYLNMVTMKGYIFGQEVPVYNGTYPEMTVGTAMKTVGGLTIYNGDAEPVTFNGSENMDLIIHKEVIVENTLESDSATNALSAAQGKVLNLTKPTRYTAPSYDELIGLTSAKFADIAQVPLDGDEETYVLYTLRQEPPTVIDNWQAVGAGGYSNKIVCGDNVLNIADDGVYYNTVKILEPSKAGTGEEGGTCSGSGGSGGGGIIGGNYLPLKLNKDTVVDVGEYTLSLKYTGDGFYNAISVNGDELTVRRSANDESSSSYLNILPASLSVGINNADLGNSRVYFDTTGNAKMEADNTALISVGNNDFSVNKTGILFNTPMTAEDGGKFVGNLEGNATTATTATTATKTQASLTFTGAVTGTWNGSAAKTVNIPASTTLASLGITATAAELNKLDGCTATTTELNYVDGVTSNIQTQLNSKASSSHTHSYIPLTGGNQSQNLNLIVDNSAPDLRLSATNSGGMSSSLEITNTSLQLSSGNKTNVINMSGTNIAITGNVGIKSGHILFQRISKPVARDNGVLNNLTSLISQVADNFLVIELNGSTYEHEIDDTVKVGEWIQIGEIEGWSRSDFYQSVIPWSKKNDSHPSDYGYLEIDTAGIIWINVVMIDGSFSDRFVATTNYGDLN